MNKITDVAVAVFIRPDGSFLLSSRPEGKPYAGYWEFPGGKIEPAETVRAALTRELIEELNVVIDEATPWFTFMMLYEHATVRLHTWRVTRWHDVNAGVAEARGTHGMHGMEGQEFAWQRLDALTVGPTLPGCVPIFRALSLPTTYVVTNASEVGVQTYLQQLRAFWGKNAAKRPPGNGFGSAALAVPTLIQLREKDMNLATRRAFAGEIVALARENGALVLVNADIELATAVGADGVHLTSAQLAAMATRPAFSWVGASVHSRAELELAATLKCDFAVLGSVQATPSHPNQTPLGWDNFARIVRDSPIPVFAIGGVSRADAEIAFQRGAHGIAMQRQAFAE
ncbi:MAG: Nudix family hydrolase [Aeromicrobium sp.]|nr:Nudix family hydrolase [Burkholderiales bacterium]